MRRVFSVRAAWQLVRAGNLRARAQAMGDGQAAVRLHLTGAALRIGLLDALGRGPAPTAELADRLEVADRPLFEAFVRAVAAGGLLAGDDGGWRLTGRGRAIVDDDLVRAAYEAFPGYHTELYRELGPLLAGGPRRHDLAEQGEVIARLSAAFEPFLLDLLTRTVVERRPQRILDVGCGAGRPLATMLTAAPQAVGVGIDADAGAARLAARTLRDRGLAARAEVVHGDVRAQLALPRRAPLATPFDLALVANVVYYLPAAERGALFRALAGALVPGGLLLVVSTVAAPQLFSRHFDLLLRAQEGRLGLPGTGELTDQLATAGLRPGRPVRVAPGDPLVAVPAVRPT